MRNFFSFFWFLVGAFFLGVFLIDETLMLLCRSEVRLFSLSHAQVGSIGNSHEDIEFQLRLNRSRRREIQGSLNALGYPVGEEDGLFGRRTRSGIRDWQQEVGLTATGYFSSHQEVNQLISQANNLALSEERLNLSDSEILSIEAGLDILEIPPGEIDGVLDQNTREAIKQWQGAKEFRATGYLNFDQAQELIQSGEVAIVELDLELSVEERHKIELSLNSRGYAPGSIDGIFDQRAREAIQNWQSAQGERATGYLNAHEAQELIRSDASGLVSLSRPVSIPSSSPVAVPSPLPSSPPPSDEPATLSRAQRQEVQEALNDLGYSVENRDGWF